MGEVPFSVVVDFFLYLFIPFIFALIASRLRSSPIAGYLIGGVVVGSLLPHTARGPAIETFAYFGIILLFFTIGLEVHFSRMLTYKRYIVRGGLLQLLLCGVAISLVSILFGFTPSQGLLLGIALAVSSTPLVAKMIQDKREEGTLLGEVTIGILMLQDLAFIPMLIIMNAVTQKTQSFTAVMGEMAWGLAVSTLILGVMYVVGKAAIPTAFDKVARLRRDLLNFFIIVFILMVAVISALLQIPIVIGAFIAGVFVATTTSHYHIFSQIRPLRDLLAVLFFIYIGSQISAPTLLTHAPQILAFAATLILVKAAVIVAIFIYLRCNARFSFFMATHLFQVGETSFILLTTAVSSHLLSQEQYTVILSAMVLSLIVTPLIITKKEVLYRFVRSFLKRVLPQLEAVIAAKIDLDRSPIDELTLRDHVIIAGYGRVGSQVARALTLANIPFIAIDYNFPLVERAKREGVQILYGDPTDRDVLDFAEVETAIAVVAAVPTRSDQEAIVLGAKHLNPKIFIISRVASQEDQNHLKDLGVHAVVQPELEASISIMRRLLVLSRKPKEEIARQIHHMKLIHGAL